VQFEFLFGRNRAMNPVASRGEASYLREASNANEDLLRVGGQQVQVRFVRHPRARRYVLRLCSDGTARVTVPRTGSWLEGRRFANRNIGWLEKQLLRQASRSCAPKKWTAGTEILFLGETVRLEVSETIAGYEVRFGEEVCRIRRTTVRQPLTPSDGEKASTTLQDLRPALERHLRKLATRELPVRVAELAQQHRFEVRRVSVRNQRSRWGSCSRHATISLNWRLVQTPIFVRDYIILHEMAHLREMNHSIRFWREVARLCPDFEKAERWLKEHSELFR
jgi:predicted metal-dependent hydrolase